MEEVQFELGIRVNTEFQSAYFNEIHSSSRQRGDRTQEIISSGNQVELASLCSLVSFFAYSFSNPRTLNKETSR